MDSRNLLQLAVLLGIGYGLYKLVGASNPAARAANAVANAITHPNSASSWSYGTYSTVPSGNVILPNGTKVPTASLNPTWDAAVGVDSFVYNGYGYIILPNPSGGPAYDQNGDYHAQ
jgi:hypothetical protein